MDDFINYLTIFVLTVAILAMLFTFCALVFEAFGSYGHLQFPIGAFDFLGS